MHCRTTLRVALQRLALSRRHRVVASSVADGSDLRNLDGLDENDLKSLARIMMHKMSAETGDGLEPEMGGEGAVEHVGGDG